MHNSSVTQPTTARKGFFARGRGSGRALPFWQQLVLQLFCLVVAASVLFPIMWIVTLSLGPRDQNRPSELQLIPTNPTFDSFKAVIAQPLSKTAGDITFWDLMRNSLFLAAGVSFLSVMIGVSAAYAFSRLNFTGKKPFFLSIGFILLMPGIATLAPLFALLSRVQFNNTILRIIYFVLAGLFIFGTILMILSRVRMNDMTRGAALVGLAALVVGGLLFYAGLKVNTGGKPFSLSRSLYGVGFAMISGALPFAIWNLKGYLDTIPKELEEAAIIDGATTNQIFFRIVLPLATPALAVTAFLGFMAGWTEFALTARFVNTAENYTLAIALQTMTGQYSTVPWSRFAAMSILISLPVSIVYLLLQKYIVGGLTLGGVKG